MGMGYPIEVRLNMNENNNRNHANRFVTENTKMLALIVAVTIAIAECWAINEINYNDWSSNGWWQ